MLSESTAISDPGPVRLGLRVPVGRSSLGRSEVEEPEYHEPNESSPRWQPSSTDGWVK